MRFKIFFCFYVYFSILLIESTAYGQTCTLPKPSHLTINQISNCSLSVTWSAVNGASSYKLNYKISTSTHWNTLNFNSSTVSTVLSNLNAGSIYTVKVCAVCSNYRPGKSISRIVTMSNFCSPAPVIDSAVAISPSEIRLYWQSGTSNNFELQYNKIGTSVWTTVSNILLSNGNYLVHNLVSNSQYQFSIRRNCCGGSYSAWSNYQTVSTLSLPNIVLFIMDDATQNSIDINNGPSFFQTPAMDQLASEGMNLSNYFSVYSLCAPSRATMVTGLYPHKTGVITNDTHFLSASIPTIGSILDSVGYFTGWVGKVHLGNPTLNAGFDFWYSGPLLGSVYNYFNPHFTSYLNHNSFQIPGHLTDITTKLGIDFLDSVPIGSPFLLILSQLSPHGPEVPRTQDLHTYDNFIMPFPLNFQKFTDDYPSFLYSNFSPILFDSVHFSTDTRTYYESMKGDEASLEELIDTLEARNLLENTLFILTGDNGSLRGAHLLLNKRLPYEESMRIPGIIRYPEWFSAGTVLTEQVTDADIAPTILDAAGINYHNYNMDGISIRELAHDENHRDAFLYESYWETNYPDQPGVRTVRTDYYKFNRYNCIDSTQEFFDLVNDPLELTNLINNPSYSTIINEYKYKLDSLQLVLGDTQAPDTMLPCNLINNIAPRLENKNLIVTSNEDPVQLFPNPVGDELWIYCEGVIESADIINISGQTIIHQTDLMIHEINTKQLPAGIYLLHLNFKNGSFPVIKKFIKSE